MKARSRALPRRRRPPPPPPPPPPPARFRAFSQFPTRPLPREAAAGPVFGHAEEANSRPGPGMKPVHGPGRVEVRPIRFVLSTGIDRRREAPAAVAARRGTGRAETGPGEAVAGSTAPAAGGASSASGRATVGSFRNFGASPGAIRRLGPDRSRAVRAWARGLSRARAGAGGAASGCLRSRPRRWAPCGASPGSRPSGEARGWRPSHSAGSAFRIRIRRRATDPPHRRGPRRRGPRAIATSAATASTAPTGPAP